MGERVVRTMILLVALMASATIGSSGVSAHQDAQPAEGATTIVSSDPPSFAMRVRALGDQVAIFARRSSTWTAANLSPSALKARSRQAVEAAEGRWMSALFAAQRELELTLGLFEVASVDAQGLARWERIPANRPMPQRVVLLIHGLDDPGDIWADAAPAIWLGYDPKDPAAIPAPVGASGHKVLRFDYPNDQPIARSADLLVGALTELRAAGVCEVDIVAHSMGGLVARDAISRPRAEADGAPELPRVPRLIMLGTPNHGSYMAHLRWVMEFRDSFGRFSVRDPNNWPALLTGLVDGDGEAGTDLLPGSDYLKELNSRPPLRDTRITIVEGDFSSGYERQALEFLESLGSDDSWLGAIGPYLARWTLAATEEFGDGAVPAWSTPLEGVDDLVSVEADHRSMITRLELIEGARSALGASYRRPPAIAIVLDRLARPVVPEEPVDQRAADSADKAAQSPTTAPEPACTQAPPQ